MFWVRTIQISWDRTVQILSTRAIPSFYLDKTDILDNACLQYFTAINVDNMMINNNYCFVQVDTDCRHCSMPTTTATCSLGANRQVAVSPQQRHLKCPPQ